MGILASLEDTANGCEADEDTPQGQNAAAWAVADRPEGKGNHRGLGLGPQSSRSGVDEGEPLRAERPAQRRGKGN
jgi:hypothetical protein